jgi:hypothetical protein
MGPVQTCAVILALWLPILLSVATLSDVGIGPNVYTTIFQAKANPPVTLNEQADLILGPAAALIGLCWLLDAPVAGWSVCGALLVLGLVFSVGKGPLGTFDEGPLFASCLLVPCALVAVRKSVCSNESIEAFYRTLLYAALVTAVLVAAVFAGWQTLEGNSWAEARLRLPGDLLDVYKITKSDFELPADVAFETHCTSDIQKLDNITSFGPDLPAGVSFNRHCPSNILKLGTVKGVAVTKDLQDWCAVTEEVQGWCALSGAVTFYIWSAPIFHAFSLLLVACCATVFGLQGAEDEKGGLRLLLGFLLLGVLAVYIVSMASGSSLNLPATVTLFVRVFAVGSAVTIWRSLTDGQRHSARESAFANNMRAFAFGDEWWSRAFRGFLMLPGVFLLPVVFAVGALKGCIMRMRDPSRTTRFSPGIQSLFDTVTSFHGGTTIFFMVLWAGFTFEADFMKRLAFVILSWISQQIQAMHVFLFAFLLSCGGFLIFMNPFAPGPVYYAISGFTITAKYCAEAKEELNLGVSGDCPDYAFFYGVGLSIVVSVTTKLAAVVGEMLIGECIGTKVWVQKIVGVEKPAIRAIEHILRQPGLFPGKVGILCGGPDWPTSVLCGFLKQSRFQMCLGTTPIAIICIPPVLAGSILNMPSDSLWGEFVVIAAFGAVLSQGLVVLVAVYYINEIVSSSDPGIQEFLTAPREEHAAVEKLSIESAAFDRVYRHVTEFGAQKAVQKFLLVASLITGFGSAVAVSANGSDFFRPFEATSRIEMAYDNDPPGLEGDVFSLIKPPQGWILLGVHLASFALLYAWVKSVSATATQVLNRNSEQFKAIPGNTGDKSTGRNLMTTKSLSESHVTAQMRVVGESQQSWAPSDQPVNGEPEGTAIGRAESTESTTVPV